MSAPDPIVPGPHGFGGSVSASDPTAAAAERARDQLAIAEAASRVAYRGSAEAALMGDASAREQLRRDWDVLREQAEDMQTRPLPVEESIIRNLGTSDLD